MPLTPSQAEGGVDLHPCHADFCLPEDVDPTSELAQAMLISWQEDVERRRSGEAAAAAPPARPSAPLAPNMGATGYAPYPDVFQMGAGAGNPSPRAAGEETGAGEQLAQAGQPSMLGVCVCLKEGARAEESCLGEQMGVGAMMGASATEGFGAGECTGLVTGTASPGQHWVSCPGCKHACRCAHSA